MSTKNRISIALLVALLGLLLVMWFIAKPHPSEPSITYSQFIQEVQAGRVGAVKILGGDLGAQAATVRLKDGTAEQTILPLDYSAALTAMQQAMVNVEIQDTSKSPARLAINAAPFLILLAVWVYFMTSGRPLLGRR